MSAEADRLDREAQQHDDTARQLDSAAGAVQQGGGELTRIASNLRTPFLQAVGNTWVGPQADKFLNGAQARYERLSRNEGQMGEVAASMRQRANWNRDEARRKRERAAQLRREEEERRRRQGSW